MHLLIKPRCPKPQSRISVSLSPHKVELLPQTINALSPPQLFPPGDKEYSPFSGLLATVTSGFPIMSSRKTPLWCSERTSPWAISSQGQHSHFLSCSENCSNLSASPQSPFPKNNFLYCKTANTYFTALLWCPGLIVLLTESKDLGLWKKMLPPFSRK